MFDRLDEEDGFTTLGFGWRWDNRVRGLGQVKDDRSAALEMRLDCWCF